MPGIMKRFTCCRWFLRKKQSKGHGVHSPFAFHLITHVIHSPFGFYAFQDIHETVSQCGLEHTSNTRLNRLSFRLVHYLKATEILEINSGMGVNTLFLTAPSSHIRCTCYEEDSSKADVAQHLQKQAGRQWKTVSSLSECEGHRYDAIFIHSERGYIPDINLLLELSHANTFWVVHPIKGGKSKQFWDKIVLDVRARITFDAQDAGIVFLRTDYHKANYFV